MQADAGEALHRLPRGVVGINRLLQGGVARIALACGELVLLGLALGRAWVHPRIGSGEK